MRSPLTAMLESLGILSTSSVGRPRAGVPPLSKKGATQVAKQAARTIGEALAPSTWKGLEASHRRLLQFRSTWAEATGVVLPWDLTIVYWVQSLMSNSTAPLSVQSAKEYVTRAVSALSRMGIKAETQLLRDFSRALRRMGALRPSSQAVPATEEDVKRAAELELDADTRMAVVLAWCGAARVSDVIRLPDGT